jgi:hypothetical protein
MDIAMTTIVLAGGRDGCLLMVAGLSLVLLNALIG